MIRFDNVSREYRNGLASVFALRDFALDVRASETVCLVGPSGSGKTTALRMIAALDTPTSGDVFVEGKRTSEWDPIRLRRSMGYVLQDGGLFPHLTVAANVGLVASLDGLAHAELDDRVDESLRRARLDPGAFGARYPRELSGGERQRAGVARALAMHPRILLMDEPFGALDPVTRGELQGEFLELRDALDTTIVLVSHDLGEAFQLGHRVALLSQGRVEQVGTEDELRMHPDSAFVEEFLGGRA